MKKPEPVSFAEFYGQLWSKIPPVWREADATSGKGLQLVVYTMAQQMYYYFYLKIVYMEELFDPDKCPDKYLKFLSSMIGWELVGENPTSWREQIRTAPLLYKMKGTEKALKIAEKLVGYSLFMAQLYKDTEGELVTKDRIFNNIPDSVRRKPWFRRLTPLDVRADLFSLTLSTSFPSFNKGTAFIDSVSGEVIYRQPLKQIGKYTKTLSTTTSYDNITGSNSKARFARTTRYNLILKKDVELDYIDSSGKTTHPDLDAALILLLEFKPFHVHIENLVVMYDLSDYTFNLVDEDSILNRESIDITANIIEQEQILFKSQIRARTCPTADDPEDYLHLLSNKGIIEAKYVKLSLNEDFSADSFISRPKRIKDANYLLNLGFSLRNYRRNTQLANSVSLWYNSVSNIADSDFEAIPDYRHYDGDLYSTGLSYYTDGATLVHQGTRTYGVTSLNYDRKLSLYDKQTKTVNIEDLLTDLSTENVNFGFYFYSFGTSLTDLGFVSLKSTLDTKYPDTRYTKSIESTTIDLTKKYNDSIIVKFTPKPEYPLLSEFTITESIDLNISSQGTPNPWSLTELYTFSKIEATSQANKNIILTPSQLSAETTSFITELNNHGTPVTTEDSLVMYSTSLGISNPSTPLSQEDLTTFRDKTSGEINQLRLTTPGILLDELYRSDYIFILEHNAGGVRSSILLTPGVDYRFIFKQNGIILNSKEIAEKINLNKQQANNNLQILLTNDDFLQQCTLHCLYLTKTNTKYTPAIVKDHTRNHQIPIRRHKKFNRIFWAKNLEAKEQRETAVESHEMYLDSTTGTLAHDPIRTRLFKQDLPLLLTRASLHNQEVSGFPAVEKYSRNVQDKTKWKVYSDSTVAYYIGPEKVSSHFWANYFNTPFSTSYPLQVPYSSVDISYESQLVNRNSVRWRTTLSGIDYTNDIEFLTNRSNDPKRLALWNRGSAMKAPIPYKSSSRSSVQMFRRDKMLASRTENSSDYVFSASNITTLSKYKYVDTVSGQTVTAAWENPTSILDIGNIRPDVDERIQWTTPAVATVDGYLGQASHPGTPIFKAVITNQDVKYPVPTLSGTYNISYTPQYDYAFSFVSRDRYYVSSEDNTLSPSLYAGNIVTNRCPYDNSTISDAYSEQLSIVSPEVFHQIDSFIVNNRNTTNYYFHNTNLFIVWTAVNSGEIVFTGYYPIVAEEFVHPSISLYHNGILKPYGEKWTFSSDNRAKIVLKSPETWINTGDILYLHYDTLNGQKSSELIDAATTRRYHEKILIQYTAADHEYLQELTFKNNPVVTWRRKNTGEFINISRMSDEIHANSSVDRVDRIPAPAEFFEEAVPDVIVNYNGIEIPYGDWKFKYYPLETPAVRIELLTNISDYLNVGDIFYLDYTGDGTTNVTYASGFGGSGYGTSYGE